MADTARTSTWTDPTSPRPALRKSPTGIPGLDEITNGGLPAGRPTLVSGGPGSGKTLLGITFLVHGALLFDEPGVLMTFEENADELAADVASLGFDLPALIAQGRLVVSLRTGSAPGRPGSTGTWSSRPRRTTCDTS